MRCKKIVLLIASIIVSLLIAEGVVRAYYWRTGSFVAADDTEFCLKELKLKRLPTDGEIFRNFSRTDRWDYNPVYGATSRKNYNHDRQITVFVNGRPITLRMYEQQHYNSKGMSNIREYALKKPSNASIRIVLFGDSFTCGDQVPAKFNIGHLLEEFIPNSEVLNFCVSGTGIETMYARYALEGKNYTPDAVWFNIFVEDLSRPFGCELDVPNIIVDNGRIIFGSRKYLTPRDVYEKYVPSKLESYLLKHILWVYNQRTSHTRNQQKGLKLLDVMLDELKRQTTEQNTTLFVSAIQAPNPDKSRIADYNAIKQLVLKKHILFFSSDEYLKNNSRKYMNQSFYYFREGRELGHFSVIGNALHAQGMKNSMAAAGIIQRTKDYYFANFQSANIMLLIPEDLSPNNENFSTIRPYVVSD